MTPAVHVPSGAAGQGPGVRSRSGGGGFRGGGAPAPAGLSGACKAGAGATPLTDGI